MAFKVVTIADRISQYPDRRRLTKEDGSSELVTVAAEEGTVSAEGTEWGAAYANDLETRIDAETHLLEGNFGTVETTTTASKAYAVGQCLTLNGQLYKVIAAISKGATLVVGTNIAVHSVSAINNNLTANNTPFYYDYQNSQYGYNTSANRGADTFHPFKGYEKIASSISGQKTFDLKLLYPNSYGSFTSGSFIISAIQSTSTSQSKQTNGNSVYIDVTKTISNDILTTSLRVWSSGVDTAGESHNATLYPLYDVYVLL